VYAHAAKSKAAR